MAALDLWHVQEASAAASQGYREAATHEELINPKDMDPTEGLEWDHDTSIVRNLMSILTCPAILNTASTTCSLNPEPVSIPPGKVSFGTACTPPSLRQRAP